MSVYVEVSGKTYDVKEKLKAFGLRWDRDRKVWKGTVSEEALRRLTKLAERHELTLTYEERYGYTNSTNTNYAWVRCWECGRPIPPGQATRDGNGKWYCGC